MAVGDIKQGVIDAEDVRTAKRVKFVGAVITHALKGVTKPSPIGHYNGVPFDTDNVSVEPVEDAEAWLKQANRDRFGKAFVAVE